MIFMRVFNGLRIGSIVIYAKNQQKYRVMELLENEGKRTCKIMSMNNTDIILEVPVELCERIER